MTINEIYKEKKVPKVFAKRLEKHFEELKWLYFELYPKQSEAFLDLCHQLLSFYIKRPAALKKLDVFRCQTCAERSGETLLSEENNQWYKSSEMLGMMMYTDAFGGDLKGVQSHLDYVQESNVNYIHLMPLMETPVGRSDGGYAVADYRRVEKSLGTMADFRRLTNACHERGISVCLDFVMNHTSENHEWARRARAGEKEYQDRYHFYDSYDIPAEYEKHVPDVFPTTAPGNFTYLPECNRHVLTTFYPYQWDLNYRNPIVFNEMTGNLLFLANQGVDIVRIDALPYIWKELGTDCRNLPQVHSIVRMIRMISEIVCPGTLLLGEVVMEPEKVTPYFGTVEKPECHMLYNVTMMATIWHTVAAKDTRLLRRQLDIVSELPKDFVFLNYLRCHDDIGWGLDFPTLQCWNMEETTHKEFLNDYFTGKLPYSTSTGELYNADPITKDARFCGTTASMCGIERGLYEKNEQKVDQGIQLDVMLHAYMLFQSGIPVLYSGDEIGQLNDWTYKSNTLKVEDSRYVHRGAFPWEKIKDLSCKNSTAARIYYQLLQLETIRKKEKAFSSMVQVTTLDTQDYQVLCVLRQVKEKKLLGIFNFSNTEKTASIREEDGIYQDLMTKRSVEVRNIVMQPYEFKWLSL